MASTLFKFLIADPAATAGACPAPKGIIARIEIALSRKEAFQDSFAAGIAPKSKDAAAEEEEIGEEGECSEAELDDVRMLRTCEEKNPAGSVAMLALDLVRKSTGGGRKEKDDEFLRLSGEVELGAGAVVVEDCAEMGVARSLAAACDEKEEEGSAEARGGEAGGDG